MIYREALMSDAENIGNTVFSSSIRILEDEYKKEERRKEVRQVFKELFREWENKIQMEAASFGICYLHSGILMRTGEIRLAMYGKEFYMDENQLQKDWQLPYFFQQYEADMVEIMDKLRKNYPRIYPYEENAVRFLYAGYYYAAVKALCRDMLEEIRDSVEYRMLDKTEDFFFFFGRWRGEAEKYICMENT